MTKSQQDTSKPSAKQLRYIRNLANSRGETFVYPQTRAQASAEIDRLKGRKRTAPADRRERSELSRTLAAGLPDAAAVRPADIKGYGSSATWR